MNEDKIRGHRLKNNHIYDDFCEIDKDKFGEILKPFLLENNVTVEMPIVSDLWGKVDNIGDLYLEKELVTGFEPVLFTCRTDSKERFLVISYNSNDGIFVLCHVTNSNLISMLKNEITMEECYRKSNIIYQTYYDEEADILRVNSFDSKVFPKEKLPEKGAYFSIKSKYIEKYIQSLKNESFV